VRHIEPARIAGVVSVQVDVEPPQPGRGHRRYRVDHHRNAGPGRQRAKHASDGVLRTAVQQCPPQRTEVRPDGRRLLFRFAPGAKEPPHVRQPVIPGGHRNRGDQRREHGFRIRPADLV
jgi:hypothetical protein